MLNDLIVVYFNLTKMGEYVPDEDRDKVITKLL